MTQPSAVERAANEGQKQFGPSWKPMYLARAPGRLELLGNHIDYNGGRVLAAAIDRDVVALLGPSDAPGIVVSFADTRSAVERISPPDLTGWKNPNSSLTALDYVRGVIATGIDRGALIRNGVALSIAGDVPIGFGLSSSAALCIALTLSLHEPAPNGRDLVLRAQEAEHRAGTPCGTMDQSASVGGNVILFDGASVSWESMAPDLGSYVFAVADSGVARSLATSSYGRRVEESQSALKIANSILGTSYASLAEISISQLESLFSTPNSTLSATLKRRLRHVVTETARVHAGIDAMKHGDWVHFGVLMNESGNSSAVDYEISHPAVETIVDLARNVPGVVGARMMGGGEGGTALILVKANVVDDIRTLLDRKVHSAESARAGNAVRVFSFAAGATLSKV